MPWYLGKPGALVALPAPSRGTQVPFAGGGATHQLLSGGQVVDKSPTKRSWQFSWQALTREQAGLLDSFVYAAGGPGPYVLVDPEQRNLLPPNVAAGTSVTGDTTGFTQGVAAALFSTQNASAAFGSLGGPFPSWSYWTLGAIMPNPYTLFGVLYSITKQIPVMAGQPYTLSAYLQPDSTVPGSIYIQINWIDALGAVISYTNGGLVAAGVTARSVVTGTAPSNAAYASITVHGTNNNSSGGPPIYSDGWQLEQAASASLWVPGLDVPYVSVAPGGGRSRQQTNQNDYSLTLVEV